MYNNTVNNFFFNRDLKTKWMTPAMEQIAQLKKKTSLTTLSLAKTSPRVTRSRGVQLKRKIFFKFLLCICLYFYKFSLYLYYVYIF